MLRQLGLTNLNKKLLTLTLTRNFFRTTMRPCNRKYTCSIAVSCLRMFERQLRPIVRYADALISYRSTDERVWIHKPLIPSSSWFLRSKGDVIKQSR